MTTAQYVPFSDPVLGQPTSFCPTLLDQCSITLKGCLDGDLLIIFLLSSGVDDTLEQHFVVQHYPSEHQETQDTEGSIGPWYSRSHLADQVAQRAQ